MENRRRDFRTDAAADGETSAKLSRARSPDGLATRGISKCFLAFATAVLLLPVLSLAQVIPEPSSRLEELHFTLGTWETLFRVIGPDGKVVRENRGVEVVTLEQGGLLLLGTSYTDSKRDKVSQRRWQFFDLYKKRLNDVTFDIVGHFERRVETGGDAQLAFAFPEPVSFQDGIYRNWRKTYSKRGLPEFYEIVWHHTEDGLTWTEWAKVTLKRLE